MLVEAVSRIHRIPSMHLPHRHAFWYGTQAAEGYTCLTDHRPCQGNDVEYQKEFSQGEVLWSAPRKGREYRTKMLTH